MNKGCFAAAVDGVDNAEKKRIMDETNWRFKYNKYVLSHAQIMASKDDLTVVKMAQQGLDYVHNTFEFVRDGKSMTVAEAMRTITSSFYTGEIKGTKEKPTNIEYSVNYLKKDLQGKSVEAQLDAWVKYGVIEQDTGDAIKRVCNTREYLDLTNHYFVLLGATSAMGPLKCLLSLGANIIAVDIGDRPQLWKKLLEEEVRPSFGSIIFPMKKPQSCVGTLTDEFYGNCGCNLITQPAEICNWLKTVVPGKPLTVGGYAYLDGLLHVKLAISMDAIMQGLCESRGKDVSLAFLCTPTDVHMIPKDAHEAAKKNLANAPFWQRLLMNMGANSLKSNVVKPIQNGNETYYLVDGITVAQGPNYALAKRMQHWRCLVAHARGHVVSTNIAPSTKTTSVVSNTQFKAAYEGMPSFKPYEIMYQETSNAVMGALLLNDLFNKDSVSNPHRKQPLAHPLLLFAATGFHGGLWRCGFTVTSIGLWAALIFYFKEYKVHLFGGLGALISGLWYLGTTYGAPHHWPVMNH
jgi:hypothetical protein